MASSTQVIFRQEDERDDTKIKSTQSARNLFSGRDIFGHISEFCYELKRLATRVIERQDTAGNTETHHRAGGINQPYSVRELDLKKERKPLLEVSKEKFQESTDVKGSTFKENSRRKKRVDDAENIHVCLNEETTAVKMKGEDERLSLPASIESLVPSLEKEKQRNEKLYLLALS